MSETRSVGLRQELNRKQPSFAKIWMRTLVVCLVIALGTGGILWLIYSTEPTAQKVGAVKRTPMLVEVKRFPPGRNRPVLTALGTVRPSQDILLKPRVSGQVLRISPAFQPGGFVQAGDVLVWLDPSDYQGVLAQKQAALRQAEAALHLEMGHQQVAKQNYRLANEKLSKDQESLVLRKPQMTARRAEVATVRAVLSQAERDLGRTAIRAPFDAHILSRHIHVGSQVTPSDVLGHLVGWRSYWVETSVPLSKLDWLSLPSRAGAKGAPAWVRDSGAWPENTRREGSLFKLVGALEEKTRMARVLIEVPDPLAHTAVYEGSPVLIIGAFVQVQIQAKEIPRAVKLPLAYLRKNDTVWVMVEQALEIRKVEVALRDADYAYITAGLSGTDEVVTTNLSIVVSGAPLRMKEAASTSPVVN